ncbi:MAG: hypothetical protein AAF086_07240 [Planctomycetota bacterium]
MTDTPPAPNSTSNPIGTVDLTPAIRRAAVTLTAIGVVGLPATYYLATLVFGSTETPSQPLSRIAAATLAGAWVWGVALLGLVPLWMARVAPPAQQVNARLGHVMIRLLLTAGGLVVLLLQLPEIDRLTVGFFGLGWYALTWVIDFALLRMNAAQAAS